MLFPHIVGRRWVACPMIFTSIRQSRRTVSSLVEARKRATLRLLGFVLSSATSASFDQGRDRFESAPRDVGHAAAGTTQKVVREGSSCRMASISTTWPAKPTANGARPTGKGLRLLHVAH